MDHRCVICIFAKPPRPGEAKTRLASALGAAGAARLARAFLVDTWAAVQAQDWARPIIASTGSLDDVGLLPPPDVWLQGDGDLGARMERILRRALEDAPAAIAVGTDSPGLPPDRALEAYRALEAGADAVFGPAEDGGFYLVGLRRCPVGLFLDLPWSQPDTLEQTRARLQAVGLSTADVAPWFDVDVPDDLSRLRRLIDNGDLHAPRTAAVLREHGVESVQKTGREV